MRPYFIICLVFGLGIPFGILLARDSNKNSNSVNVDLVVNVLEK